MKILVIVAMQKELDLFLPLLENVEEFEIQGHRYHRGNIGGHHVTLGKCGIGKVNSAISTLRLIRLSIQVLQEVLLKTFILWMWLLPMLSLIMTYGVDQALNMGRLTDFPSECILTGI